MVLHSLTGGAVSLEPAVMDITRMLMETVKVHQPLPDFNIVALYIYSLKFTLDSKYIIGFQYMYLQIVFQHHWKSFPKSSF